MTEGRGKTPPPPDDRSEAFHGDPIDAWTAIGKTAVTIGALVLVVFATLLVERADKAIFRADAFRCRNSSRFYPAFGMGCDMEVKEPDERKKWGCGGVDDSVELSFGDGEIFMQVENPWNTSRGIAWVRLKPEQAREIAAFLLRSAGIIEIDAYLEQYAPL